MAKKTLSISDQISNLEANLDAKNSLLKEYDKLFEKYLKITFGKDKKEIESLIRESQKPILLRVTKLPDAPGEEEKSESSDFSLEGGTPSAF